MSDTGFEWLQTSLRDGSRQVNLGWTVMSVWTVGAVFLGLLLIGVSMGIMVADQDYRDGNKSKTGPLVLDYIGLALVLFGLLSTVSRFHQIIRRIDADVAVNGACSVFTVDTAAQAIQNIAGLDVLPLVTKAKLQKAMQDVQADIELEYGKDAGTFDFLDS